MPRESLTHQRERAQKIEERLFAYYGEGASSLDWETPYQLTVAVVLAAQCSDAAVNKVTPRLWQSYPEPQDLAAAPLEEIEEHLRTIGLFRTKAARIKELAQLVTTEYGGTVPHDIDLLQRLPGVGRKTANCVMCEAFKDPQGIAVDTHVFRIAHRLGFATKNDDTPDKTEAKLLKVYPREQWGYINHQWVWFGREFCRARVPRCAECLVAELCPSCKA